MLALHHNNGPDIRGWGKSEPCSRVRESRPTNSSMCKEYELITE